MASAAAAADAGWEVVKVLALLVVLLAARTASADILNNELLHAHVDEVAAAAPTDAAARADLFADRTTLSLGALVPVLGTYRLDHQVFGSVRPSAVAFDWILGGAVPVGLGVVALLASGRTRSICAWSAVGLYASTRIAILTIGNLHVSEYNAYLHVKLAVSATETRDGSPAPALVATGQW
jgi:hypothetical protein